jgi:hypothetical protein
VQVQLAGWVHSVNGNGGASVDKNRSPFSRRAGKQLPASLETETACHFALGFGATGAAGCDFFHMTRDQLMH